MTLRTPAEILDAVAERQRYVTPLQEHMPVSPGMARTCVREAFADALKLLVMRLRRSPMVAAVAGAPHVTNHGRVLLAMQTLEAAAIIQLIRRTQSVTGRVGVVAGVLALYHRDRVLAVGGYDPRMATEDIDLTWKLVLAGWETLYEPHALVGMQVPATLALSVSGPPYVLPAVHAAMPEKALPLKETESGWLYQPFESGGRDGIADAVGFETSTRIVYGCVIVGPEFGQLTVHETF